MIVFYNIAFFIPLLPALLALLIWKRLSLMERIFAGMLWMIVVISFLGRIWSIYFVNNNLPFFHVYILFEFIFLLIIFSYLLEQSWKRPIWLGLGGFFLAAWILNITVFNSIWLYPDIILALESIIVIGLVIVWFRKVLREKVIRDPAKTFSFWMTSGLLLYFSGDFLLFVFSNFLKELDDLAFQAVWMVHTVLVILLYLMYTTGLLWILKRKK